MKICKKVNQKRKQFNSAANRLGDIVEDAGTLIANAQKIQKEVAKNADKPPETKKDDGKAAAVPAWKKKSLEFRAAMLAAKAAGGDSEAAAKAAELNRELKSISPPDQVAPDMIKCPTCGRTFNLESGKRHIEICAQ